MYIIQNKNVFRGPEDGLNQFGANTYYVFEPRNTSPAYEKVLLDRYLNAYKDVMLNPWTVWGNDQKLESIRLQRNYLLQQTDWVAIRASETVTSESQAWKEYRQQLRDFPNTVNVNLPIEQIVWPISPNK